MSSDHEARVELPEAVALFLERLTSLSVADWVEVRAVRAGRAAESRPKLESVVSADAAGAALANASDWIDRGVANGVLPADREARAAMDGALSALVRGEDARTGLRISGYGPFNGIIPLASLAGDAPTVEDLAELLGTEPSLLPERVAPLAAPTVAGTIRGVTLGLLVFAVASLLAFPMGQVVGGLIVAGFGYRWVARGYAAVFLRWLRG